MRAIVIGAGEVGFDVARILAFESHDVIVVDIDEEALSTVSEKLDVMTFHGGATSADTLIAAGAKKADFLIAVTTIDEVNIIACMMARRLGVKTTVARVRSDEITRNQSLVTAADFGIDAFINPEESTATEVVRLIRRASATDVLEFDEGRFHLVGMRLDKDSIALGRTIQAVDQDLVGIDFRVVGITRGIRTLLPHGLERFQFNDQIFVFARPKHIPLIAKALGKSETRIQNIMILGGTQIGARVADQLSKTKNARVKLVEPDPDLAEKLANELAQVLIINGDTTDIDLLVTEGLGEMDAIIALSEKEESNLVACLMAKHLGVYKTVALLSKGGYVPISQAIGLDAAVSPKLALSREIMQFLRSKHIHSVATVHGLDLEILEVEAQLNAPITRKPLAELDLPTDILISAVMKKKKSFVATGKTQVQAGDKAIVFSRPSMLAQAEALFRR